VGTHIAKRTAYAAAVAQLSKATLAGTVVVGKEYGVKVIETTPGYQPFPSWSYTVVAKTGDTQTTLAAAIVALINDTTNLINKDSDPIVTATNAAGVISLTAKDVNTTFRIAFTADAIADLAATATYTGAGTASSFIGSGTPASIIELEKVGNILKGVTTNIGSPTGATPSDFGAPTAFASTANQYSLYFFTGEKTETSPTPIEKHVTKHYVILAIPSNGIDATNPDLEVKTIFGL
jgi:hypothetical protein